MTVMIKKTRRRVKLMEYLLPSYRRDNNAKIPNFIKLLGITYKCLYIHFMGLLCCCLANFLSRGKNEETQ